MLGDGGANAIGATLGTALVRRPPTGPARRARRRGRADGRQREGQLTRVIERRPCCATSTPGDGAPWTRRREPRRPPRAAGLGGRRGDDRRRHRAEPRARLRSLARAGQAVRAGAIGGVYNAANTLPNVLFEVAAGGALAGALVPVLARPGPARAPGRRRDGVGGLRMDLPRPRPARPGCLPGLRPDRGPAHPGARRRRTPSSSSSCWCSPSRCRCTGWLSCCTRCSRRTSGSSGPRSHRSSRRSSIATYVVYA